MIAVFVKYRRPHEVVADVVEDKASSSTEERMARAKKRKQIGSKKIPPSSRSYDCNVNIRVMSALLPLMSLRPSCTRPYRSLSRLSRSPSSIMPLKAKILNPAMSTPAATVRTPPCPYNKNRLRDSSTDTLIADGHWLQSTGGSAPPRHRRGPLQHHLRRPHHRAQPAPQAQLSQRLHGARDNI